jgi:hypothetical protein
MQNSSSGTSCSYRDEIKARRTIGPASLSGDIAFCKRMSQTVLELSKRSSCHNRESGGRMNKYELLKDAILTIAQRAGIERPEFHLTSVSRDSAGVFIMQTTWPDGRLICEKIAREVAGFPKDPFTTCVALLPDLVDEIIWIARKGRNGAGDPAFTQTQRF